MDFKNIEGFLERLPNTNNYNYVVEFRHPYWKTEGPGEMLWHYNIGAVIADLRTRGKFGIFVESVITTDHSFIRFHGRNASSNYWYNYRYSKEDLDP